MDAHCAGCRAVCLCGAHDASGSEDLASWAVAY